MEVYDKNGNLLEILNTVKEVKEKYKLNSAEINRILKGIKQHKFLSKKDKHYIRQWTMLDVGNPVFDSYVDHWKSNTFDLGKSILGKEESS